MMGGRHTLGADYKIYQISFFVGFPIAIGAYVAICRVFPPPGLGISESLDSYESTEGFKPEIIEGTHDMEAGVEKGKETVAVVNATQ